MKSSPIGGLPEVNRRSHHHARNPAGASANDSVEPTGPARYGILDFSLIISPSTANVPYP
jgi:hypothetical protein